MTGFSDRLRAARHDQLILALLAVFALFAVAGPGARAQVSKGLTRGALYADGQTNRYLVGGEWSLRPDPGDVGLAEGWWRPAATTAGWSTVTVPNAYNAGNFSKTSMNGYPAWYRRDFTLPQHAFPRGVPARFDHWILRFESVNYRATVWLNGRVVGRHAGAYLPFEFVLRGLRHGVNHLVVRVDDRRSQTDLPSGPGGGWWNYGGLLREVYLRPVAGVDLSRVDVRPALAPCRCRAVIGEHAFLHNLTDSPQTVRLHGFYGAVPLNFGSATIAPHETRVLTRTATIRHPRLWSPARPALYRASLKLSDSAGHPLGGYVTYSGIRSVTVTPDGRLELNGRLLDLRGVDLHEQDVVEGAALDTAHLTRMIGWVRAAGADLIRSHYPLNPQILEMADRYGILIWSEIPVWRVSSANLAKPSVVAKAHAMLTENIETNQNHPSVLLWSVGNELQTPATRPEAKYIAGAARLARRLDPTRPVGMAVSDWPGVACQRAYAPLDVLGFNDYFGWFDAGGGSTDDRDELSPFLDSFRACYPHKALFVSEFGFDGSRHGPVDERGTYEFQADSTAFHLAVFASKPWLSGAIFWLLQDFAAYPGASGGNPWPDPPFIQKGMFDLQGRPKPVFSVVRSYFKATVQVASFQSPSR